MLISVTQSGRDFYYKNKERYTHIISIVCPDDDITPLHSNHLVIKMWDIDKPMENKFRRYEPPTKEVCLEPIKWVIFKWKDSIKNKENFNLLVHCDAGISRSSAITLGILWSISNDLFKDKPDKDLLRVYLDARKYWCYSILDEDNSYQLRRYIDGRFNPGVRPNQAILSIYKDNMKMFPW